MTDSTWDGLVNAAIAPFRPDRTKYRLFMDSLRQEPYWRAAVRQRRLGATERALSALLRAAVLKAMERISRPSSTPQGSQDATTGSPRPRKHRQGTKTPPRQRRG